MALLSQDKQKCCFWPPKAAFRPHTTLLNPSIHIIEYVYQDSYSVSIPFPFNLPNTAALHRGTTNRIPNFRDHLTIKIWYRIYVRINTTLLSHGPMRMPKSPVPAEHILISPLSQSQVSSTIPPACAKWNGKRHEVGIVAIFIFYSIIL